MAETLNSRIEIVDYDGKIGISIEHAESKGHAVYMLAKGMVGVFEDVGEFKEDLPKIEEDILPIEDAKEPIMEESK